MEDDIRYIEAPTIFLNRGDNITQVNSTVVIDDDFNGQTNQAFDEGGYEQAGDARVPNKSGFKDKLINWIKINKKKLICLMLFLMLCLIILGIIIVLACIPLYINNNTTTATTEATTTVKPLNTTNTTIASILTDRATFTNLGNYTNTLLPLSVIAGYTGIIDASVSIRFYSVIISFKCR